MNATQIFAFFVLPVLLVVFGGIAVVVHNRVSAAGWQALEPRLKAEATKREAHAGATPVGSAPASEP